jgi:TonB-linked SusC/RagA family outer membrane protein
VTIAVKGTTLGVITDVDGNFSLEVPADGKTLVASFVGMKTVEVPITSSGVYNFVLESTVVGLDEVVVTALGISKARKALGYVVQDVSGDDLKKTAETNVINALAGKSAGVYINSSNGNVGASSRIVIRGNSSLLGNNQPLFVVDGVPIDNSIQTSAKGGYDYTDLGNGAADINPSDIAEMTILKGANAASLYGSRGANGVILITTKTGNKKGFTIEVENSTTFSNPLVLPDFQNQYGQGGAMQFLYKDGLNGGINDGVDESFGPELDYVVQAEDIAPGGKLYWAIEAGVPQTVGEIFVLPQFDSPIDSSTGERIATPWISHPDNVKNYYETGITSITNFAMSNGGKWGNMRLSATNSDQTGMVPNTYMVKNTFNLSGQANLTDKLSFDTRASYINSNGNVNGSGYTFNNVGMQTIWTGRQVDWNYLKNHVQNADGTPISWINRWHDNPYWMAKNFLNEQTKNRFIGSASLKYQINDWLSMLARAGTDYSNQQVELKRAYYSLNSKEGYYSVDNYFRQETNADFLLSARKEISTILTISGNLGGNIMNKKYRSQGSTVPRLVVPYVYSLSNAKDTPTTTYYQSEKEIQSLYGAFSMELWGQLFVDVTGRNDWSSTLPETAQSYFYPSVNTSWIFTDFLELDPSVFTFGKIRLGWAQVGNDTDPYRTGLSYSSSTPYGDNPSFSATSVLPPLDLKNELITSTELGFDLKFFNNRLGIDATFYKSSAKNQIMSATMSATSGYNSATINAGQMDNKGIELILSANPIATKDFSWDVMVNWSTNKNEVVALNGDIKKLNLYTAEGNQITVTAEVGGAYGDMWGKGFVYHENGKPIVGADGVPLTSDLRILGNIMPDWLAGISNSFNYKGLQFGFLIDAKVGGDVYSRTNQDGWATGALKSTVGLNANGVPVRDPIADGGGYLFDGVFADGTPNTIYKDLDGFRWNSFARAERWIYDASYVKLREVSMSYSLPGTIMNKLKPINGVDLGVFARNVAILYTKAENFDPEVSNKDASQSSQGSEFGSNPSARNIGFRVKVTF